MRKINSGDQNNEMSFNEASHGHMLDPLFTVLFRSIINNNKNNIFLHRHHAIGEEL